MMKGLTEKPETVKLLKENIGEKFHDIEDQCHEFCQ